MATSQQSEEKTEQFEESSRTQRTLTYFWELRRMVNGLEKLSTQLERYDKHGVRHGETGKTASPCWSPCLLMVRMPLCSNILEAEVRLLLLYWS